MKRRIRESMTEEGFKYSILASGSQFFLPWDAKEKLLIDAGLSGKKITGLLAEIDRKTTEDLDAIFDYARTLRPYPWCGCFSAKYGMLMKQLWKAMENHIRKCSMMLKSTSLKWKTKTFGDDIESFGGQSRCSPLTSIVFAKDAARASSCWRIRAMWVIACRLQMRMATDCPTMM